jgi:hypothetical protein
MNSELIFPKSSGSALFSGSSEISCSEFVVLPVLVKRRVFWSIPELIRAVAVGFLALGYRRVFSAIRGFIFPESSATSLISGCSEISCAELVGLTALANRWGINRNIGINNARNWLLSQRCETGRVFSAISRLICSAALVLTPVVALAAGSLPVIPWITQSNIQSSICIRGFTRSIRPPVSVTNEIKHRKLEAAGMPFSAADTKLDHIIPLALGGAPDDERNLALQGNAESHDKDRVELCLARTVCAGRITLAEAQSAIWSNWRTAGRLCSGYSVIPSTDD